MLITIKILTWLASPLGVFVTGMLLGLVLMIGSTRRKPRRTSIGAWAVMGICSLQLVVFSLPPVADGLLGNLEKHARETAGPMNEAQRILQGQQYAAIVVLGGSMRPAVATIRPHPDLNDAADRLWHAARLYKRGLSPRIIVSGGRSPGLESRHELMTEAHMMRQFLIELGIPAGAILMEEDSRTTRENAEQTKRVLASLLASKTAGASPNARIALVTSAFHMPRAAENFKQAGFVLDRYPTDFRVAPQSEPLYARLLPNAEALFSSTIALKEHMALFVGY